nr:MAG TPA: hypothetical protein [Caudoviricetes sp.]
MALALPAVQKRRTAASQTDCARKRKGHSNY